MYLLYTDEVNVDPENSEFFVYAGVAISGEKAPEFSTDIEKLRRRHGYGPGDLLKFNTRERPAHISREQHLDAKRELMEAAGRMVSSSLHHSCCTTLPRQAGWMRRGGMK